MSMTDPIADMLTRIRNAVQRGFEQVSMPCSKIKKSIAQVLKDEGFIEDFDVSGEGVSLLLNIRLQYFQGKPAIATLDRVSRPGLKRFVGKHDLPRVKGGFGSAIISTSQGVMTAKQARALGVGGEVLCNVSS